MQSGRMGLEDNKGFKTGTSGIANRCETQGGVEIYEAKAL